MLNSGLDVVQNHLHKVFVYLMKMEKKFHLENTTKKQLSLLCQGMSLFLILGILEYGVRHLQLILLTLKFHKA